MNNITISDPDAAPTGTNGGGMGSGAGLDTDDLQDAVDGKPVTADTKPADGAGTGNYANAPDDTDNEQSGVAGEVNGETVAGGI